MYSVRFGWSFSKELLTFVQKNQPYPYGLYNYIAIFLIHLNLFPDSFLIVQW